MKIRKILKTDVDKLADLMVCVFNQPPWNDDWTIDTATNSIQTILEFPNFYGNVMLDGEKIIGAIMGHIRAYSKENTFYIYEFFVSNEYQRQKIGTQLYQFTINDLKSKNIDGAFFTTLKNSPAYEFYIKQGACYLKESACFYHEF